MEFILPIGVSIRYEVQVTSVPRAKKLVQCLCNTDLDNSDENPLAIRHSGLGSPSKESIVYYGFPLVKRNSSRYE